MEAKLFYLLFLALIPATLSCDTSVCGIGGTCTGDLITCTSCGTLSNLQSYLYADDSKCYVSCPNNTYKNINTVSCINCHTSCSGCSGSPTSCMACATSFYRVIGSTQCTNDCGTGYYGDINQKICTVCP